MPGVLKSGAAGPVARSAVVVAELAGGQGLVEVAGWAQLSPRTSSGMRPGRNLLDAGGSLDEVQELLGCALPSSAQVYVHPHPARLRAAVDAVPSPGAQMGVTS
jgi:hypothetical protein